MERVLVVIIEGNTLRIIIQYVRSLELTVFIIMIPWDVVPYLSTIVVVPVSIAVATWLIATDMIAEESAQDD